MLPIGIDVVSEDKIAEATREVCLTLYSIGLDVKLPWKKTHSKTRRFFMWYDKYRMQRQLVEQNKEVYLLHIQFVLMKLL